MSWQRTYILSALLVAVVLMAFSLISKQGNQLYPMPELSGFPPLPETHNPPTLKGVTLGRYLFYDPILSRDSSMSCGSCHRQEAAFSDASKRFSQGIDGQLQVRNTPALFNLAWYEALFWDGRSASLEEQVFVPVSAHNEMDLQWILAERRIATSPFYRELFQEAFGEVPIDSVLIAKAIAQFERTLISANSKYDRVLRGEEYFTEDEYEGFILVNEQDQGNCLQCHPTDGHALATTGGFSDNGIQPARSPGDYSDPGRGVVTGDSLDAGKFKIPSLRNLAFTAPYMHDGSLNTLEEVLEFYSAKVHNSYNLDPKMGPTRHHGVKLTDKQKQQVLAFLATLNDSVFVADPRFSNPFE